jgi:hypothetical protein
VVARAAGDDNPLRGGDKQRPPHGKGVGVGLSNHVIVDGGVKDGGAARTEREEAFDK